MAVRHVTYLDLTAEQRRTAAARVRDRIRTALANPFLDPTQRALLATQIDRVTTWERGTLAVGSPVYVAPVVADDGEKS